MAIQPELPELGERPHASRGLMVFGAFLAAIGALGIGDMLVNPGHFFGEVNDQILAYTALGGTTLVIIGAIQGALTTPENEKAH